MASQLWDQGRIVEGLNAIRWSPDTIQDLENTVLSGLTGIACANVSCMHGWHVTQAFNSLIIMNNYVHYYCNFRMKILQLITPWMESLNLLAPINLQTSVLVLCLNPAVRGWLNSTLRHHRRPHRRIVELRLLWHS